MGRFEMSKYANAAAMIAGMQSEIDKLLERSQAENAASEQERATIIENRQCH